MHHIGGQKEQLAFAILERGAKDRNTWLTGGVKGFEICLSSCHCDGHSTNRQNVALRCQGLLHFWQRFLNSSECGVTAFKVAGLRGSMCRKILDLSFHGMFAQGKQREGIAIFVSLTSCLPFNLIFFSGQVNFKKSAGGFENVVVLKKT